ncbi:hypothetical protein D7X88_18165 [bacterium C-53]|nr:hypothetical protein [Lachnospiraceae bacterium]NBI04864.1 hypothetical protein [Lachnospiraceae bacterium]RKJ07677.1 hypothetical protein D7X88_18165 [bacterium C-53]
MVRQGKKAVIHVKLVQEGGKLIFSVRNLVAEKVEVIEDTGLSNVKAVVDKYGAILPFPVTGKSSRRW